MRTGAPPSAFEAAPIVRTVVIDAPPAAVWRALTEPAQMVRWMSEPELRVEVLTDWKVGGPFTVRGELHGPFENSGRVLAVDPPVLLRYSHLSSVSRLPELPESHTVFEFRLEPSAGGTSLLLTVEGFPTESIYRHLDFYWRGTLTHLKRHVESTLRR